VQEQNPEVVAELLKIADEARKDLGDGINDIKGANVREPGKVK
jgi:arylsulfatase